MWAHGQRGNKRNSAEKENNVASKQAGHIFMKIDLVVRPFELADHPHRATERQEHPEKVTAPARRASVQQKAGVGEKRDASLDDVAESDERRTLAEMMRYGGVEAQKDKPGPDQPRYSAGVGHNCGPFILRCARKCGGCFAPGHGESITVGGADWGKRDYLNEN